MINSWNFKGLDPKTIWHGNEHAQNVTVETVEKNDGEDKVSKTCKSFQCIYTNLNKTNSNIILLKTAVKVNV